jgi:hypothetical protein
MVATALEKLLGQGGKMKHKGKEEEKKKEGGIKEYEER